MNGRFSEEHVELDTFNIFSPKGNANQTYTEIPSHPSQNACHQESKQQQMLVRMGDEKEPSCTIGGNVNQQGGSSNKSDLPDQPAIPLLGIYPKECESVHKMDDT
jgi:hypothetical protein